MNVHLARVVLRSQLATGDGGPPWTREDRFATHLRHMKLLAKIVPGEAGRRQKTGAGPMVSLHSKLCLLGTGHRSHPLNH